jgi:hypothetical protein
VAARHLRKQADRLLLHLARHGTGWLVLLGGASLTKSVAEILLPATTGRTVDAMLGARSGGFHGRGALAWLGACAAVIICRWRPFLAYDKPVNVGFAAGLFRLNKEGGLALLAVAAGEPVGSKAANRGAGSDEYPAPMLCHDQALALEYLDRVPHGHPRYAVMLHELRF